LRLGESFCLSVAAADEPRGLTNSLGMRFVRVPAGEFLMGSPDGDEQADDDERPQHAVRIAQAFYLGVYEVTQTEFESVMDENPSWFSRLGGGRDMVAGRNTERFPVEMVSWDDAARFCRRLAEVDAERVAGRTYRLPTEAEWEYACRAGGTTRFAWADVITSVEANIADPSANPALPQVTRPVGSYLPNAWGLHDMHGNVWEWCSDWYSAEYYESFSVREKVPEGRMRDASIIDPLGPAEGNGRVVRGGDYRFDASQARSANRDFTRPTRRDWGNGFRVVLMVAQL
jgi:formylglycine-generating enzyme required for sulfatase activity